jgi:uracil-DNA glycosylase
MKFDTWAEFLEHNRPLLTSIEAAVKRDAGDKGAIVYPAYVDRFRFTETPLRDVRVVILGQDPYYKPGQADGLAFSVRDAPLGGLPPSLRNIIKELRSDIDPWIAAVGACDLTPWTRQGVLLLNTALTVRHGEAGSHCGIWQPFTDEVIRAVCDSATVAPHFVLWGAKARNSFERTVGKLRVAIEHRDQEKKSFWVRKVYRYITATYSAHPSPKSANLGFFGSRPFSRANLALTLNNPGCAPVDWRLS